LDYSLILFFSVEGAHTILPKSFSFFLFSTGGLGQTGKPWENVVAVQSWSMTAIHLGIGHITGWTVGDQVCQVAPPSQQANLDVIICQDDVVSKKYCCFRIP